MPKQALHPADYPFFDYSRLTFSLGIVAGGGIWLSGSTAARFDPEAARTVVEGDLVAQTRVVLEKTRITLAAGGLGLGDIARVKRSGEAAVAFARRVLKVRSSRKRR